MMEEKTKFEIIFEWNQTKIFPWFNSDAQNLGLKNFIYNIKKGKGLIKEFLNGVIIFEGEYINGERNGKEENMIIMVI